MGREEDAMFETKASALKRQQMRVNYFIMEKVLKYENNLYFGELFCVHKLRVHY